MTITKRKPWIKRLIALGRKNGSLTYAQINEWVPDPFLQEDINELMYYLEQEGIDLVEGKPETQQKQESSSRKYGRRCPWSRWFAAGNFELMRHTDYDCMPHGMAQMVRNVAAKYGHSVSVHISEDQRIQVTVHRKKKTK